MAIEKFSVRGALNESVGDADSRPVEFKYLVNCVANSKLGALRRRPGSSTDTISGTQGIPLGAAEYTTATSEDNIPVEVAKLYKFGQNTFFKESAGTYSSITADANTSFSSSKPMMGGQLGGSLLLAGGRPAKWTGTSEDVERIGIPAPATAITHSSSGTGITGTFSYMWTYYNSTSGLESDWSPLSTEITVSNKQIDLTLPTTAASAKGVDKKRIYRTQDEGATYYLLTTEDIATASYADTTTDANLGAPSARIGDYQNPPTNSYIMTVWNGRAWFVDAANPYFLRASEAHLGNDNNLEYYPSRNQYTLDAPITGLFADKTRLLIFHPRAITQLTGSSNQSFRFSKFYEGVGTLFADSIASDGERIAFLAEEGFVYISPRGIKVNISREIRDTLDPILRRDYNNNLFVSGIWNPGLRQVVWSLSASSTSGDPWIFSGSGFLAEWENSSTMATAGWEDSASPGAEATNRVLMWGWSPNESTEGSNVWTKYEFAQVEDLNGDAAYITGLFHPLPSSDELNPQQEITKVLYYDGTEGQVLSAFDWELGQDDATSFEAEYITGRINPSGQDNYKRFHKLQMENSYQDMSSDGNATFSYLRDYNDPHLRDYSSNLTSFAGSGDRKQFTSGKARFIHLHGTDTSASAGKVLLDSFSIQYDDIDFHGGR